VSERIHFGRDFGTLPRAGLMENVVSCKGYFLAGPNSYPRGADASGESACDLPDLSLGLRHADL
jgi:hypothetical protein